MYEYAPEQSLSVHEKLIELLAFAFANGYAVSLSIHNVTRADACELVEAGLIDAIEKGAASNGPTGRLRSGDDEQRAEAVVFTQRKR